MNTKIAVDFLTRCFRPEETIALLLRREDQPTTAQRIVRLEQAIAPRYLAWLAHENHTGASVYVAANPLHSGSRKRTKDSIAEVRHLYLDIDEDGDNRLAALRASEDVPVPSIVLSTSPNKYQVLWRVEGFDFDQQEATLKLLAIAFGGDSACTDRNRVLRVPGFKNCKYEPAHPVTAEYLNGSTYRRGDFRLDDSALMSKVQSRVFAGKQAKHKNTHSEQDWAWAVQQLSLGEDALKLTHQLALRRPDKPNPLYYAQRTIDIACARRSLLEGTSIESVIAMLVHQRSAEVPAAPCHSRAREIATTAQRMIARQIFTSATTLRRTTMPLLEVVQTRQISASIRLTDTTATQVDQYAAFIRACADDVVEQALAYVFSKDRDFQDFLKTPEARKVSSTLRIRKAPAAEAPEPTPQKPPSAAVAASLSPAKSA